MRNNVLDSATSRDINKLIASNKAKQSYSSHMKSRMLSAQKEEFQFPIIANIFMEHVKRETSSSFHRSHYSGTRYIDDVFLIIE